MKERPILFSGPMVRALLDGSKTQTRRAMREQVCAPGIVQIAAPGYCEIINEYGVHIPGFRCPYGKPGDRLWVREAWANDAEAQWEPQKRGTFYRADDDAEEYKSDCAAAGIPFVWRPSIHMHRWRSRITLEITDVRVERLNDCSDADALAEGVDRTNTSIAGYAKERYQRLWESINGPGSWAANPWVWVVEFLRITP